MLPSENSYIQTGPEVTNVKGQMLSIGNSVGFYLFFTIGVSLPPVGDIGQTGMKVSIDNVTGNVTGSFFNISLITYSLHLILTPIPL